MNNRRYRPKPDGIFTYKIENQTIKKITASKEMGGRYE